MKEAVVILRDLLEQLEKRHRLVGHALRQSNQHTRLGGIAICACDIAKDYRRISGVVYRMENTAEIRSVA